MSWLISRAMMEAYANSRSSLGLAAEYSAVTCSDGEPFAQLNVMPTQHPFWRNDKTTDICARSPFGLTSRRLMDDHGAALLTSFLAGFHARTCQSQDEAQGLMEHAAGCGENLRGLLARYDPATHSLKTVQGSLFSDLTECSVTLPRSGTMRNGECYQRPMLERRTKESGFGLLPETIPTPTICGNYNRKGASKTSGDGLATYVRKFPTPCARDYKGARSDSAMAETGRCQATNSLPDALQSIGNYGPMNPTFPEWLMGWPIGWTESKPLETDKFREWRQAHSFSCEKD